MIFNYLKKLWNGKIQLYIVFWVYSMFAGTLLSMITIEKYHVINGIYSFVIHLLFYTFSIFINKALWSSSANYKGWFTWSILTKIFVILDLIWLCTLLPLRIFYPEAMEKLVILLGVN